MRIARRFAVFTACAALLAACGQSGGSSGAGGGGSKSKFTDAEYVMGSPGAKVSVVEYLSDTCSHCAAFDAEVWPKIKAKYVDTGKVKWSVREFLTPPEQVSAAGFLLARCAGKDKYFSVIESIFHSQEEMFKTGDFKTPFQRIATSMGMSDKQFNDCLQDDNALKALYDRVQKAQTDDKIDGTPTFIVNGKKIAEAEISFENLSKALDAAGAN